MMSLRAISPKILLNTEVCPTEYHPEAITKGDANNETFTNDILLDRAQVQSVDASDIQNVPKLSIPNNLEPNHDVATLSPHINSHNNIITLAEVITTIRINGDYIAILTLPCRIRIYHRLDLIRDNTLSTNYVNVSPTNAIHSLENDSVLLSSKGTLIHIEGDTITYTIHNRVSWYYSVFKCNDTFFGMAQIPGIPNKYGGAIFRLHKSRYRHEPIPCISHYGVFKGDLLISLKPVPTNIKSSSTELILCDMPFHARFVAKYNRFLMKECTLYITGKIITILNKDNTILILNETLLSILHVKNSNLINCIFSFNNSIYIKTTSKRVDINAKGPPHFNVSRIVLGMGSPYIAETKRSENHNWTSSSIDRSLRINSHSISVLNLLWSEKSHYLLPRLQKQTVKELFCINRFNRKNFPVPLEILKIIVALTFSIL